MTAKAALVCVKLLHTLAWAFFASCIFALPAVALAGHCRLSAWLTCAVLGEVAVLAAFHWRCPLTAVAARFTGDRSDNFGIYLPLWLARYNKQVFGTLFVVGGGIALWVTWRSP